MKKNITALLLVILTITSICFISCNLLEFTEIQTGTEVNTTIFHGTSEDSFIESFENQTDIEISTTLSNETAEQGTDDSSTVAPPPATSEDHQGFRYTLQDDGTYCVSGYTYLPENIDYVIPSTHNNVPVTAIGESAFANATMTSIVISDSVTHIGANAFDYCLYLRSVDLPEGLTTIENGTFHNCQELSSVSIPSSVTVIGDWAFARCFNITTLAIPDGVTRIGKAAFHFCQALSSIHIPATVTSIGEDAFDRCIGMTDFTVAKENPVYHSASNCLIETAGKTLMTGFGNCTIPADGSITGIGEHAFFNLETLTEITIPDTVTYIGPLAFSGCEALTSVILSNSITEICDRAFSGCTNLTSISIPDSVTKLGSSVFSGSGLTSVTLPESITTIPSYTFANCRGLTSVSIPDHITAIEDRAFSDCINLISIVIPTSVTYIEGDAFHLSYNFSDIYYLGSEDEWKAIEKGPFWSHNTGHIHVHYNCAP